MHRLPCAILSVLLAFGTVLPGCSRQPETGASASPDDASTHAAPAGTAPASATAGTPEDEAAPAASVPATAEPATDAAPGPVIRYRLNKAYDVVPIDTGQTEKRVVLITFDDGPKDAETLTPILEALDRHQAKAIFFVNGYRVEQNPGLLQEIDRRGHAIGNHSWDHIELGKQKPDVIREQIGRVQEIVRKLTGKAPRFFRPPFASANEDVRQIAREHGLLYMTWSNGSLDWDLGKAKNKPQAVIDNVMEQLRPGSNILMHELPWTAEALDALLTRIRQAGYGFVDPHEIETPATAS